MKNFISGLVLGALLTGVGAYLSFPKYKQEAYDGGISVGNKEGMEKGRLKGIEEGIAQGMAKAEAEKKAIQDSLNQKIEEAKASRKVVRVPVPEKPKIQNWRVLGNNIAEPIAAEEEPTKTK